jgi:hypothetical protein
MTAHNDHNNSAHAAPRPYFVPPGVDFDQLPEQVRAVILGIINPAYRELVLAAPDGLQKAAGVTVVSLLWLEVLDQLELGQNLTVPRSLLVASPERDELIARHLRTAGAKIKASSFLLRLAEFREKYGHLPGARPAWAQPIEPSTDEPEPAEGE